MSIHIGRAERVVGLCAAALLLIFAGFAAAAKPPKTTSIEEIKIWNLATMQEQTTLSSQNQRELSHLAFSRDGKILVGTGSMRTKVWDPHTGKELPSQDMPGGHPVFLRDGRTLAFCGRSNVTFWDLQSRQNRSTVLPGPPSTSMAHTIGLDGKLVVGSITEPVPQQRYHRTKLMVWDATTGKPKDGFEDADYLGNACLSSDGKLLATSGSKLPLKDRNPQIVTMKLWNAQTGKVLKTIPSCIPLGFSPDGKTLALVDELKENGAGSLLLFDIDTEKRVLVGPGRSSLPIAFSSDGRFLGRVDVPRRNCNVANNLRPFGLALTRQYNS